MKKVLSIFLVVWAATAMSFTVKTEQVKPEKTFAKIRLVTDCGYATQTAAQTCLEQHMQQLAQHYLVYDDLAMVVQERDANGNYTGRYCYEFYYDWHP